MSVLGGTPASIAGLYLCQNSSCFVLPEVESQRGYRICAAENNGGCSIAADGALGPLDPASGEMGLFASAAFDDPDALLSYVEWGDSGHAHSSLAVQAGIWWPDAFVSIPDGHNQLFWNGDLAPGDHPSFDAWMTGTEGG